MSMRSEKIPKKYHDAVVRWRDTYLPDYNLLIENWDRFFPKDPEFRLCAFREMGMCGEIECGDHKGKPKAHDPSELAPDQAAHLLLLADGIQGHHQFHRCVCTRGAHLQCTLQLS